MCSAFEIMFALNSPESVTGSFMEDMIKSPRTTDRKEKALAAFSTAKPLSSSTPVAKRLSYVSSAEF